MINQQYTMKNDYIKMENRKKHIEFNLPNSKSSLSITTVPNQLSF